MDGLFNLKLIAGPYGDCTSTYEVVFSRENVTVGEFVNYVLSNLKKEWGLISIGFDITNITFPYNIEYKYGKMLSGDIPNQIKEMPIKQAICDGGWTLMNYSLEI